MDKNDSQQVKKKNTISCVLNELKQSGEDLLERARKEAYKPNQKKTQRNYSTKQACELIGVNQSLLRSREGLNKILKQPSNNHSTDQDNIFKPRKIEKGKRSSFVYNLEEINLIRDHFNTRPKKPKGVRTRIIATANFKGGSLKSTTSVHMAHGFALKGYRVLLIDCDSQGSATIMSGINPDGDLEQKDTISDVLLGSSTSLKGCIRKTHWSGLDFIPANLSLYYAELVIPQEVATLKANNQEPDILFHRLHHAIDEIKDNYDLIILDTAPSVGVVTTNALIACNGILVPIVPSIIDYASTLQFLGMIGQLLNTVKNPRINFLKMFISKHDGKNTALEIEQLIRLAFASKVMKHNMISSEAIIRAATSLQTIFEVEEIVGDRRAYKRAFDHVQLVIEELEVEVRRLWFQEERKLQEKKEKAEEQTV